LLKYLKHQGIIVINHNLLLNIKANWFFRVEDRYNSESSFITDLQISKSLNNFEFFVKSSNLFNVSYSDFVGIPLPGRWVSGGIKLSLSK
jgi:iron complex outermembrane receptor protein